MSKGLFISKKRDWALLRVLAGLVLLACASAGQVKENLGVVIQNANLASSNVMRMGEDDVHYVGLFDSAVGGLNLYLFDVNMTTGTSRVVNTGKAGEGNLDSRVVSSHNHKLYFASNDPCYFYKYDPTLGTIQQLKDSGWPVAACGPKPADKAVQTAIEGASGHLFFGTAVRGTVFQYDTNTGTLTDYGLISPPVGNPTCSGCYRYVYTIQADNNYVYAGMRDASTNEWWLTTIKISDGTQTDCWKDTPGTYGILNRRLSDNALVYNYYNGVNHWYLVPTDGTCPVATISPAPDVHPNYWRVGHASPDHAVLSIDGIFSAPSYFNVDVDLSRIDVDMSTGGIATLRYRNPAGSGLYITKTATIPMYDVNVKLAKQRGATDDLMVVSGVYGPDVLRSIAGNTTTAGGKLGQSTYGITWDGTYWYFAGYSASLFRFDPKRAWTVNGGTPATACGTGSPTNPCGGAGGELLKYPYYVVPANDSRVYIASRDERSGQTGGGIAWYRPSDNSTGSYRNGPPSLACFNPNDMIAMGSGSKLAYSGSAVNNAEYSCAETAGKIFLFDVAAKAITATLTPNAGSTPGKLIELPNGHIMGMIANRPATDQYTIYSIDPATGALDWTVTGSGRIYNNVSHENARPVLGPDGYAYVYIGNNLVKVSPSDGKITTVYADSTSHGGMSVVAGPWGKALYFWGSTNLYRMVLWRPIAVTSGELAFDVESGGAAPPSRSIAVTSTNPNLTFTVSANSTGNWLKISPATGKVPATLAVSMNAAGLAPGTYQGSVAIVSGDASNSPLAVPVTLTVRPNNLAVSRNALSFAYQRGGAAPSAQSLSVSSSGSPLMFTPSVSTVTGGNWLQAIQINGSTPGALTVSVDPGMLSPGTYNGVITIAAPAALNSPEVVSVTLTVTEVSLQVSPAALTFSAERGDSVLASQIVRITGAGGNAGFSVSVSGGSWLSVNRATGTTPADLIVTGNPSQLRVGTYSGSINVTAATGIVAPAPLPITLSVVARTPRFSASGVVNAASFLPGVTPGGLVSIFGSGLSELMGVHEPGGQLSFQGATVSIGGRRAPLLAISAQGLEEQINLQVPFETEAGKTTTVEVDNNGKRTKVEGVPVLAAQPGIFQVPVAEGVNVAAAIHADGQLVSPGAPARRGEIISMFLTGGGALQPVVATGDPGPVPPATIMQPVVVGVANIGCAVYFSGYAPGFVGLYQINFEVPPDAPVGASLNLVVKVGEVFSSPAPLAVA